MQNNNANVARIDQLKMGLASFVEAIDELPADATVNLQLGFVTQMISGKSLEEAKTVLRKFAQSLSALQDDLLVLPTVEVVPVNTLHTTLTKRVQGIYEKKAGIKVAPEATKAEVEAEAVAETSAPAQAAEAK